MCVLVSNVCSAQPQFVVLVPVQVTSVLMAYQDWAKVPGVVGPVSQAVIEQLRSRQSDFQARQWGEACPVPPVAYKVDCFLTRQSPTRRIVS